MTKLPYVCTLMCNKRNSCLLVLLVLLIGTVGEVVAKGSNVSQQAHQLMQEFFDAGNTPGLAVSVGFNGEIIWSEGFGYADLEQGVRVDPARTRFRIGSVIKPMTAFAVAQLFQAGQLDLDAPVQTYVPGFPVKQAPVTTRQLLGHLAGIRHYNSGEVFSREYYDSVTAGLAIFQNDPLKSVPGETYSYTSYGYNLISAVIEGASGQDYLAYMATNVFEPLAMQSMVADKLSHIITGRGRYYFESEGKVTNAPEVDNSYKWASGGIIGTSDDLVRFGLAQLGESTISDETREMFWTEQITSQGDKTEYGLGWAIRIDEHGQRWVGHGGGSIGGTTQFWIRPDDGMVIAMISNVSQFRFETILISLAEVFASEL